MDPARGLAAQPGTDYRSEPQDHEHDHDEQEVRGHRIANGSYRDIGDQDACLQTLAELNDEPAAEATPASADIA